MAVHLDASVPLRPVCVDEYFRMGEAGILREDERIELLRGALVEMSPPSPPHDDAVEWLNMRLVPLALEAGLSVRVQSALVLVDQHSVPLPDLVVLDRRRRGSPHPSTAHLAIEVSVTSRRVDLALKAGIYAEAGIPEYWVVDVPRRRLVRHADPQPDGYVVIESLGPGDDARCASLPSLPPIPVADVFDGELGG